MNDQNLADLIIENIEPKNTKSKSVITILALMIVLLVMAIVLTKIIIKSPNEEVMFEETNTDFISPELTLKEIIEEENVKPPVATLEPISFNREDEHEDINQTKKEIVIEDNTPIKIEENIIEEVNNTKIDIIKKSIVINTPKNIVEVKKTTTKKKVVKKPTRKPTRKPARKPATKKPLKKPVKKVVPRGRYYIQVGSFTRTPNKNFLNVIKKGNFNYVMVPNTSTGSRRLLIGPYPTSKAVRLALPKVRDRINKNAFVYKK